MSDDAQPRDAASPPATSGAAAPSLAHLHPAAPTLCCACASSTSSAAAAPPPPPPWSNDSSPPVYRPIRIPAINAPAPNTAAIILSPVPQPLAVPAASPPFEFQIPSKQISSPSDLSLFHSSDPGRHFLGFVAALSYAARGLKLSDDVHLSPSVSSLLALLQTLQSWISSFPPVPHPARYGNPAFRSWHQKLGDDSSSLLDPLLVGDDDDGRRSASIELAPYLLDSFGNPSRIDYGTGHETNFAAFLYCLARLGVLAESDFPAVVVRVFASYLDLMRELQATYQLEPAGSHGVWGLDDYHFLPFVFGSAQLMDHKYMKPKSIHNQDILDNFSNEYMYLACVSFVKKVKRGPFSEHSPMLDDISGVPSWSKVNSGMLKMYKAEVLEKVPIMQHFLFGSLIKWENNQ